MFEKWILNYFDHVNKSKEIDGSKWNWDIVFQELNLISIDTTIYKVKRIVN